MRKINLAIAAVVLAAPFQANAIPLAIVSAVTDDVDANGQIDRIVLQFDAAILDSTVDSTDFDVGGYTGIAVFSGAPNDAQLFLIFAESGISDLDAEPLVTYTPGQVQVQDLFGDLLPATQIVATAGPVLPGVSADVRVKGDIKSTETANGGTRELAEFVVRFTVPDGVTPPSQQITIDFDAIPTVPCIIVAIPAGAFVPTANGNGYRLISDEPKLSGVQILQVDDFGNLVADLTGQVTRLQARLHNVEGEEGAWRLAIEARADTTGDNPVWLPAAQSIGTNLIVGTAKATAVARRASFVQIVEPPTAIPQDPIAGPNLSAALADLRITGEVKLREPDDDTLREVVAINARFALGLSDGIQPPSESLIIDFNAVPPVPCNIVAIPAGAFVPTANGNGYRLISSDPKISGVRHLLTDGQGQFLEDLTPDMRRFDAVLRQDDDGGWRLRIEAVSRTEGETNWLPILSLGANLSFGNDYGSTRTRRVQFMHGASSPTDEDLDAELQ